MELVTSDDRRGLIVVGAGPAGLAVAIAAHQAGLDYEVVEKGVLVNGIFHFPRAMTFFTTPDLLEIGGLPFVTPYEKPKEVLAVAREQEGLSLRTRLARRDERVRHARNVVLATGYYDHPNRVGIPGEDLPHVSHYYDEPHPFYRKRVVVVGGKNSDSAAIAALELHRAGAQVTLVHRREKLSDSIKYWIKPDIENRIKAGAIAARFSTRPVEIRTDHVVVEGPGGRDELAAEAVFLLTGYHPDADFFRRAGIRVDEETLKPEHDPLTLESNVPGLYLAGSVVSGRETSRIFIENGRFHGEMIVKAITSKR